MRQERRGRGARRKSPLPKVFAVLLLLAFCGWFFWWSQNSIQTERVEISGAPSAFDGFSIAVLSDIHGKEFGEDSKILIEKTRILHPDIIVITGDLLHAGQSLDMVPALAEGLCAIAPTYYITGNHEWAAKCVPELKEMLSAHGVTVLSNEYVMLEHKGAEIALLGADDNNGPATQKTISQLADEVRQEEGADTYLLLLSHRNNRYELYAQARVNLTLAGHAHGGMIRLPFTDGLIGPHREWLPYYTAGIYELDYGEMFVSRGLSDKEGFRLFNRPHLPLIVLQKD